MKIVHSRYGIDHCVTFMLEALFARLSRQQSSARKFGVVCALAGGVLAGCGGAIVLLRAHRRIVHLLL